MATKNKKNDYEEIQKATFSELIEDGRYSDQFEHAPHAQKIFLSVINGVMRTFHHKKYYSILDCGCGNGAWLHFIQQRITNNCHPKFYGFDLTPEMVELTSKRLSSDTNLQAGNILDTNSYIFSDGVDHFDVIFTYDVIQQLPARLQYEACRELLNHLKPSGIAVIFDNDKQSLFGRKMAFRKFVTRYWGISLVPKYFCNASYPPLAIFAKKIEKNLRYQTEIKVSDNGMKRALIIRKID